MFIDSHPIEVCIYYHWVMSTNSHTTEVCTLYDVYKVSHYRSLHFLPLRDDTWMRQPPRPPLFLPIHWNDSWVIRTTLHCKCDQCNKDILKITILKWYILKWYIVCMIYICTAIYVHSLATDKHYWSSWWWYVTVQPYMCIPWPQIKIIGIFVDDVYHSI